MVACDVVVAASQVRVTTSYSKMPTQGNIKLKILFYFISSGQHLAELFLSLSFH